MGLDRRQLHDVGAQHQLWDIDAILVNVIQYEHIGIGTVAHPVHIVGVQNHMWQPEPIFNSRMLVVDATFYRVDDDRPVVGRQQVVISSRAQCVRHTFDLPRRR